MSENKWLMFKNYLHNELGITKDDIRSWVKDAVIDASETHIAQYFASNPIERTLEKKVEKFMCGPYGRDFKTKLVKQVGSELAKRVSVTLSKEERDT